MMTNNQSIIIVRRGEIHASMDKKKRHWISKARLLNEHFRTFFVINVRILLFSDEIINFDL